jgi:DNA-binding response OmpR family regulator
MSESNKKTTVVEIIEDDIALSEVIHDKLALEGFSILKANDGEEGLVMALREKPDLILLDIMMPNMDGATMIRKLREANEWGKNVPVIFLTNLNADNDKINQVITDYEPAYYLVKSNLSLSDLVKKIKERLSRPS